MLGKVVEIRVKIVINLSKETARVYDRKRWVKGQQQSEERECDSMIPMTIITTLLASLPPFPSPRAFVKRLERG